MKEHRFTIESAAQVRAKVKAFQELTDAKKVEVRVRGPFQFDKSKDQPIFISAPDGDLVTVSDKAGTAIHRASKQDIKLGANPDLDFPQVCILRVR